MQRSLDGEKSSKYHPTVPPTQPGTNSNTAQTACFDQFYSLNPSREGIFSNPSIYQPISSNNWKRPCPEYLMGKSELDKEITHLADVFKNKFSSRKACTAATGARQPINPVMEQKPSTKESVRRKVTAVLTSEIKQVEKQMQESQSTEKPLVQIGVPMVINSQLYPKHRPRK